MLTDDVILYVAETLHKEPLFGLLAVAALQQCQHRLRQLLRALVKEQPAIRDRSCDVTYTWNVTRFSMFQTMPTDTKIYSPEFSTAFGHNFRLILFPKGDRVPFLSLYLEVPVYSELSGSQSNLSSWYRRVNMALRIPHPGKTRRGHQRGIAKDYVLLANPRLGLEKPHRPRKRARHASRRHATHHVQSHGGPAAAQLPRYVYAVGVSREGGLCTADPDAQHAPRPEEGFRVDRSRSQAPLVTVPVMRQASLAALLLPPRGWRRRGCSTVECAGCPVAASHALLRRFVDEVVR